MQYVTHCCNFQMIATSLLDSMGLNKPPTSIMQAPTATRLSSRRSHTASAATNSFSNSSSSWYSNIESSRYLSKTIENDNELDVMFDEVIFLIHRNLIYILFLFLGYNCFNNQPSVGFGLSSRGAHRLGDFHHRECCTASVACFREGNQSRVCVSGHQLREIYLPCSLSSYSQVY